ncbi:MAG TPA: nitroreductase family protein [Caldisericia bacterium]|nr:nitroreductase family protein [Caldisericia bacterium]HOR47053.1 nitroreductase family protein [Caldisericia bacterium]HOU08167.1 nitroreductase family protein [Caldisericia bacterium]HPL89138.1 nitroreductase family protein [Caldisericia bacterium]HQG59833.1 nitroreductase family protein [Caldisericia bacterium]
MDVKDAILARRAYRSLEKAEITDALVEDLIGFLKLAPSCFNNQPWRFIFVKNPDVLLQMQQVMSKGNEWTFKDSMIVVVLSKKENDCVIYDREYHLFDTGMAVGFMILRATELGLVAHPIAGYSPKKTRAVLGIPDDWQVITLVNVGKHSAELNPVMSEKQVADEKTRPERLPNDEIASIDKFDPKLERTKPLQDS